MGAKLDNSVSSFSAFKDLFTLFASIFRKLGINCMSILSANWSLKASTNWTDM